MTATALAHPKHQKDFADRLLADLKEHEGEWRPLGRLYAAHLTSFERSWVVREIIDRARHAGFVIEGDNDRGYRLTGYHLPERIYTKRTGRPPKPSLRLIQSRRVKDCPGQLRLEDK
jgi:hypothetical protein